MKFFANLSILWIFLVTASPLAAEVESNLKYEYYTVQVSNKDDVNEKAFDATPINIDGLKFLAFTKWLLNYNYSPKKIADTCQVDTWTISHSCVITLPKFVGGDARLQRMLTGLVAKLRRHELIHCLVAREYAYKLDRTLLNHFSQYKCPELADAARRVYDKILGECEVAQREIDGEGGHGWHEKDYLAWFLSDLASFLPDPNLFFPDLEQTLLDRLQRPESGTPAQGAGLSGDDQPGRNSAEAAREPAGIYKDENGVWKNY